MLTCSPSSVDVNAKMDSYVGWVGRTHSASDSLVDSRVEAKFLLPDATPFSGPWCRPQNDGPGLRAITLISYANQLLDEGKEVRAYAHRVSRAAAAAPQKGVDVLPRRRREWMCCRAAEESGCTCGKSSSAARQNRSFGTIAGVQPAA